MIGEKGESDMNNKEFTTELARRLGYTQKDAACLVASVASILACQLQEEEGKSVMWQGFGTFEVKKRLERIVINPVTGKRMMIPPKLCLAFRPSQTLKEMLKEKEENGR